MRRAPLIAEHHAVDRAEWHATVNQDLGARRPAVVAELVATVDRRGDVSIVGKVRCGLMRARVEWADPK